MIRPQFLPAPPGTMLSIKNDQIKVFASLRQARFIERLLSNLAEDYPAWYAECQDRGAREFVERAIETGRNHGIRGKLAVSTLVGLMVEFGEKFENAPDQAWAVKLLTHPSLPEGIKVSMLAERLRERAGGRRIVEIEAG